MKKYNNIDFHMHSIVSDGTDFPEEIVQKVKKAGIEFFSVSDHDAIKGCEMIKRILTEDDPKFITGAEFSCRDEHGKYHILGYMYDPSMSPINELVDKGHSLRMNKVKYRLDAIKTEYGFAFSDEDTAWILSQDNPGKPHIANMMVKYGYAESKEQAFYDYLNKIRVKSVHIRPEEAIQSILDSNGVPVLAHPSYGDGDQIIVGDVMAERMKRLVGYGLKGVEAFYSGFTPKLQNEMLGYAEQYDLYVTAGSDYHGRNKGIELGDNNLDSVDEYPDGLKRFLELAESKL